ncbi:hypothetical protein O3M35_012629 [Rhynocoris fuscipes]|uniref:Uncharacterized protein n=1 Tax=Rhynocoris fuscipes TaxID=488301 RepID=A0AAW1CT22_9HEMI
MRSSQTNNNFRESFKKIFNIFKSNNTNGENNSEDYSQEFKKPYVSSRNILLHDRPVKVHVALTKSKPGDKSEQLISKQSLTELMRNDSQFNSFTNNQYQLKSTVVIEGIKERDGDKSVIYVNDSIPVSLRRRFNGKKKNKEITIRCKLYKADCSSYPNGKYHESDTVVSPLTMRKVDVPLQELRSSLNGFTRRLSTFEEVPWLTAVHHIPQTRNIKSGEQLNLKRPSSVYKPPKYTHYFTKKKSNEDLLFKEPSIEHKQAFSNNMKNKKSLSFPTGIKPRIFEEFICMDDNNNDNLPMYNTVGTITKSIKWKGNNNVDENINKLKSCVKISMPIIRQTTSFRNKRNKVTNNINRTKYRVSYLKQDISEQSFETASNNDFDAANKKLLKLTNKSSMKANNLMKRPVLKNSVSSKRNYEEFVNAITNKKSSFTRMSTGGVAVKNSQEVNQIEEIPVTSIVITRSRTRLIKYNDGTDIEEKVGRQTVRVDAPPGALYARYTPNSSLLPNTPIELNGQNYDSRSKEQELFCMKYPEIDLKEELKQQVPNESPDKYSEILADDYNPLTWLYSHYNKTKSLILQFSNKN